MRTNRRLRTAEVAIPSPAAERETPPGGLTSEQAAARLARDGPNTLPAPRRPAAWRRLAAQMVHFFALMLWVAGALAFIAGLPELGVAIFVVIVLNAVFAFAQEHRADQAAERLRDLLPRRATVIRGGRRQTVDAAELVLGDLVILEGGDRVSADMRLREAHALQLDTSLLTGESVPVAFGRGETVFAGTFVTEGEAVGVVVATGGSTRLAEIARLAQEGPPPRPPLVHELHRLVRTIAVIAVSMGGALFAVALTLGMEPVDGFVFGIGVTVALVPEALLPTVTLSLAVGAQRMAQRNALVRKLESVETLGSTTFICTDKTGTLTRNEMAVVEAWTPAGRATVRGTGYEPDGEVEPDDPEALPALRELERAAARCSSGRAALRDGRWVSQGDPMEAAIDVFAKRLGVDVERDRVDRPERGRFPFDPRRRRMSILAGGRVLVKGAPDAVLGLCHVVFGAEAAMASMTERGLRVIAVASRPIDDHARPADAEEAERELDLLGLVGLEDPPRAEAAGAIAACRRAGVRVAMVTGDHPATALAVAREVGLCGTDGVALTGAELASEEGDLGAQLDRDGLVVARVEPEDKLRIARALQARGHVVAMTGDGVNDAPALHEADIGVAMGRSGTDVAREAADLVLLDDDFATIVAAIEHGRGIFANVKRFLTYHLTDNVAEVTPFLVWALSGGRIPLALGVLQILALDIGTDTLSATALGAEPPEGRVLDARPSRGRLLDASVARRAFGLLGPVEAGMAMLAFFATFLASGWRPGEPFPQGDTLLAASGAAFVTVVIAQTANAFACRSTTRTPWALGWFTNRLLVGGALIEFVIAMTFVVVPILASALGQLLPTAVGWIVAVASAGAMLAVDAAHKWFVRTRRAVGGARRLKGTSSLTRRR